MSVAATLSENLVEATPGRETAVTVRVLNDGDLVDELGLDIVGEPGGWARVVPERLLLLPGDSGTASVVFAPPRDPTVHAGVRRFGIRVRSSQDADASTVEEGTAIVAAFTDVAVAVRPPLRRRRGRVTFEVDVDNAGNAPLDVRLDALDPEDALRYAFSATRVTIAPGLRAGLRLHVRPRRRAFLGAPRPHAVTVRAWYGDDQPATANAAYLQTPLVPAWAVRAAVLCTVLAVLAGAALLALAPRLGFPPRATTTARESTATQEAAAKNADTAVRTAALAQQQAAAAEAAAAGAAAAASGAAAKADAAAKVAGDVQKALASPPPEPYAFSLPLPTAKGATATFAWEPLAERGLSLTDLVLMTTSGDAVDLRVRRGDDLLFLLHADTPDPRALDLTTPVAFPPNTLTLDVTCLATPDPGPEPTCEPVVYVGGHLTGGG